MISISSFGHNCMTVVPDMQAVSIHTDKVSKHLNRPICWYWSET